MKNEPGIKHATFDCLFIGEDPPQRGWKYVDSSNNEWTVQTVSRNLTVLSDKQVWSVTVGALSCYGTPLLNLKRKLSSQEIRDIRQHLQSMGAERVLVADDESCVYLEIEEVKELKKRGVELPGEVNGVPVVVYD